MESNNEVIKKWRKFLFFFVFLSLWSCQRDLQDETMLSQKDNADFLSNIKLGKKLKNPYFCEKYEISISWITKV